MKNIDYSSDSRDEEEDNKLMNFIDHLLVTACEEGHIPWDYDPVRIVNFLKESNETHGWSIPIDMENIKTRLAETDMEIKKMSRLYQKRHNLNPTMKENDKKKPTKYRRNCSTSSLSTFEATTSYSQTTENSDTTKVSQENSSTKNYIDKNPIQETMVAEDEENPMMENEEPRQLEGENKGIQAAMEGQEASVLFIRRKLSKTDMCDHQNRLSMPCSQVMINEKQFFTKEERKTLKNLNSCVPAKLIDPGNRPYDVNLRKTKAGQTSCSYAIGKPWNEIKRDNKFEKDMVLDVRVFRGERGQLCFLLRRVDKTKLE